MLYRITVYYVCVYVRYIATLPHLLSKKITLRVQSCCTGYWLREFGSNGEIMGSSWVKGKSFILSMVDCGGVFQETMG